jgi:hypothetical protein
MVNKTLNSVLETLKFFTLEVQATMYNLVKLLRICGREGQIDATFRFCLITPLPLFLISCVSDSFKHNLKMYD